MISLFANNAPKCYTYTNNLTLCKETFMPYFKKANDIKETNDSFVKTLTDDALHNTIQSWLDSENKKSGYIIGLSPQCNVTHFSEILSMCGNCDGCDGRGCTVSNILMNLASCTLVFDMLKENKANLKNDTALDIIENRYPPYSLLKEYVTRNCKGQWLNF